MFLIIHSNFIQALGLTLFNSLWQAALIWLCYKIIINLTQLSSSKKYWLAIVSELIIFILFISTFISLIFSTSSSSKIILPSPHPLFIIGSGLLNNVFFFISVIYLSILMFLFIRWFYIFFHIQKYYHNNLIPAEIKWQQWFDEKVNHLNIKKKIKVFLSDHIKTPLTIGFIKPVILLPAAVINYLTIEELESVLLHELAHIKRNDYFINIFFSIIEIVLYFNPFVIYFKKAIKKERENCCDDEVILQNYSSVKYSVGLLKLSKYTMEGDLAFTMNAVSDNRQLLQRIQRINKIQTTKNKPSFGVLILFMTILIISVLSYLSISTPDNNQRKTHHETDIKTQIITRNIYPASGNITADNNSAKRKAFVYKSSQVTHKQKSSKNNNDEVNLDDALVSLKQINIPQIQNNIEEYRKNLSENEYQLLSDNSLKERIKKFVTVKNISIKDFAKKIDSLKINQSIENLDNNTYHVSNGETTDDIYTTALYIEKDSLNQYLQENKQVKHVVVINSNESALYYLVIRSTIKNNEPVFIFIPYKPERTVD